mmetsp:Transcript_31138/g.77498  ORF Transcript_31138/g.77498 Transcript_31138/m.77498 type:complete len:232 (+) Transcript_31138:683-1378(+)
MRAVPKPRVVGSMLQAHGVVPIHDSEKVLQRQRLLKRNFKRLLPWGRGGRSIVRFKVVVKAFHQLLQHEPYGLEARRLKPEAPCVLAHNDGDVHSVVVLKTYHVAGGGVLRPSRRLHNHLLKQAGELRRHSVRVQSHLVTGVLDWWNHCAEKGERQLHLAVGSARLTRAGVISRYDAHCVIRRDAPAAPRRVQRDRDDDGRIRPTNERGNDEAVLLALDWRRRGHGDVHIF